jgi:hypothetical protein
VRLEAGLTQKDHAVTTTPHSRTTLQRQSPRSPLTSTPPVSPVENEPPEGAAKVIERPDGFHWIDEEGRQEFGPFETLEAATASMEAADEAAIEQAEQVEEVERALDLDTRIDTEGTDEPEGAT